MERPRTGLDRVSMVLMFLMALIQSSLGGSHKNITAHVGDSVTLPCQAINNANITFLEICRFELKDTNYLFLYRDGRFDTARQLSAYQNRVKMVDKEMKNGNANLTLMDVRMDDEGMYWCSISHNNTTKEEITTVNLIVHLPGKTLEDEGKISGLEEKSSTGALIVGLLSGVVILVLVVYFIWKRCKGCERCLSRPLNYVV